MNLYVLKFISKSEYYLKRASEMIKSKEEMRKEGIKSPNISDALALTFNKSIEDEAPKIYVI